MAYIFFMYIKWLCFWYCINFNTSFGKSQHKLFPQKQNFIILIHGIRKKTSDVNYIIDLLHVWKICRSVLTFLIFFNFILGILKIKMVEFHGRQISRKTLSDLYAILSLLNRVWTMYVIFQSYLNYARGIISPVIHVNKTVNIMIHLENTNLSKHLPQNHYPIAWLLVIDIFSMCFRESWGEHI